MKGFCPLASGSKGNCLYFGSSEKKILIDVGISCRALNLRLQEIGVSLDEIDAIFVTHDHTDHIAGLKVVTSRYQIPIVANSETAKGIVTTLGVCPSFKIFSTGESFTYGDIEVSTYSIPHDTMDPVGFTFTHDGVKWGVCADLGFATPLVAQRLKGCDYLYLEANHEPDLVHHSKRPMVYKQRVLGRTGHLSNQACGELLRGIYHPGLKHVYLAHLSGECNQPELALEKVGSYLAREGVSIEMSIAWQAEVSLFLAR